MFCWSKQVTKPIEKQSKVNETSKAFRRPFPRSETCLREGNMDGLDMPKRFTKYFSTTNTLNKTLEIDISMEVIQDQVKEGCKNVVFQDIQGSGDGYAFGLKKGIYRKKMEDRILTAPEFDSNKWNALFAIFDGHSGYKAAEFCKNNLLSNIKRYQSQYLKDPSSILRQSMKDLDSDFLRLAKENGHTDGTTCLTALILQGKLYLSNIGDSSAFIIKRNQSAQVTVDHTPQRQDEFKRIEKLGGVILPVGRSLRVEGVLSVSRAIGDIKYKKFITSDPDISEFQLSEDDEFLLLASDGVAKMLETARLHETIFNNKDKKSVEQICTDFIQEAERKGTRDNMSLIVVNLRHFKESFDFHINSLKSTLNKLKTESRSSRQGKGDSKLKMNIEMVKPLEDDENPHDMSWTNISTEHSMCEEPEPFYESSAFAPTSSRHASFRPLSPLLTKRNSQKKIFSFGMVSSDPMDCS